MRQTSHTYLTRLPHHTCCPRYTQLTVCQHHGVRPQASQACHYIRAHPLLLPIVSVPQDSGLQLCCHCLVMW